jgi:hypothetical protein
VCSLRLPGPAKRAEGGRPDWPLGLTLLVAMGDTVTGLIPNRRAPGPPLGVQPGAPRASHPERS